MVENVNVRDEVINGIQCKVYYPANVNSNTQVALYMHGGGDDFISANDAVGYLNNSNNTNSIVIIPNASDRTTDAYFNSVVKVYDDVIKQNGINQNNLVISGYSSGYCSTFGVLNKYLEKHPNSDSASVYLIETYPQSYDYSLERYKNYYDYNAYKNNDTMFYSYTGKYGNGNSYGETYDKILNPLSQNGCNVINILEGREVSHVGAEKVFFEDGIIDFSKNRLMLSGDSYVYQVKNLQTGKWEEVDVNNINTFNKVREYFRHSTYLYNLKELSTLSLNDETISTDADTLLENINNVYNAIKNSTFVVSNYISGGGSSTTKVPASIPDVINKYFSVTSNLLCDLAVFLKKCEESNALMEKTEKDIENDAGNVNSSIVSNLTYNWGMTDYGSDDILSTNVSDESITEEEVNELIEEDTNNFSDDINYSNDEDSNTNDDSLEEVFSEDEGHYEITADGQKVFIMNLE